MGKLQTVYLEQRKAHVLQSYLYKLVYITLFLCKIICFYLVFVGLMLGLFFLIMIGSTEYIRNNYDFPWINKNSLVKGGNPGVGFIPNLIRSESPLLWYTFQGVQSADNMKYKAYVNFIDDYLKTYDEAEQNIGNYSDCAVSRDPKKPCIFRRKDLGPCGKDEFGYPDKKPCIYIKVNKLPNWSPKYYKGDDLPDYMPTELQETIKKDSDKKKLYIHCRGVSPADAEHLGKISYHPYQGIMGYYFPYSGLENYLTPLVAVKIDNVKKGYVASIQCSAWARNMQYSDPKTHSTHIQMYLAID